MAATRRDGRGRGGGNAGQPGGHAVAARGRIVRYKRKRGSMEQKEWRVTLTVNLEPDVEAGLLPKLVPRCCLSTCMPASYWNRWLVVR